MNEQTPADVLREARHIRENWVDEDGYAASSLRFASVEELLAALDAAGFRVSSKPDDDTRRDVEYAAERLRGGRSIGPAACNVIAGMLERWVLGEVRSDD